MDANKLNELWNSYSNCRAAYKEAAEEYIKENLATFENSRLEFEKIDPEFEDNTGGLCVTYDGGNHPEYDTNPYSTVNAIYLDRGKIYLDTADCNAYALSRVWQNTDEVAAVADVVMYCVDFQDEKKKKEER